jgi:hypothetical protein
MLPYRTSGWDGHNMTQRDAALNHQRSFGVQVTRMSRACIGVNHNHRGNRLRLH